MTIYGRFPSLTFQQVVEIREWHKVYSTLLTWKGMAQKYGVSVECIRDAATKDKKRHV